MQEQLPWPLLVPDLLTLLCCACSPCQLLRQLAALDLWIRLGLTAISKQQLLTVYRVTQSHRPTTIATV